MIKDRVKLKRTLEKIIDANFFKLIFIIIFIIIVIKNYGSLLEEGKTFKDYIEINVIISFLIAFVCEWLSNVLEFHLRNFTEDRLKETSNYKALCDKYELNGINKNTNLIEIDKTKSFSNQNNEKNITYPEILLGLWNIGQRIEIEFNSINDENGNIKHYKLPGELEKYSETLFNAHRTSSTYNSLHIRTENILIDNNKVKIVWSYTTYFNSLLTNRAMDYPLNNFLTVRELFEPGPFINSLNDSKLSNHLGFNGLIEIDGKIIMIKRWKNVSIGKRLWQTSTNSSFKVKYGVSNDGKTITRESLSNAIKNEIRDELRIIVNENIDLCDGIFAFYRDLVEGGKPQFLYYFKIDTENHNCKTADNKDITCTNDILKYFKSQVKGIYFNKNMMFDGNIIEFIDINDLKNAYYDYDSITLKENRRRYKMTPSNVVSILLLLKELDKNKV